MTPVARRRALLAAGAAALPLPALGQAPWPSRPIRVVVPYAAGGGTDILARALGEALRPILPQPVVVENRSGAAGVVGSEQVVRSEPDGHTLLAVVSTHVMNKHVMAQMPFDPIRDVTPVAMLSRNAMVLAVGAQLPFHDIPGLARFARENPGRLSTGSTEALSSFIGQELARRLRIDLPDVAYRSGGPLMTDVVAGHLPMGWTSTASATPHMQTGRARVIAVASATRTPFFPDAPAVEEQGVPDFDLAGWVALLAPPGMAPALAQRIHDAVAQAFATEGLRARLLALGVEQDPRPPAALLDAMRREDAIWARARAAGHIRPE